MSKIQSFIRDESGAAAAEYALILALIGAAVGTAMLLLRDQIIASITRATTSITTVNGQAGA